MSRVASGQRLDPAPRARVLTVDDHDPFRDTLRVLVRSTALMQLVGEAVSGEHALELAHDCKPDLVLMDVHMPGIGGASATLALKAQHPSAVVVLISTTRPDELSPAVSRCGAAEVVWKSDLRPRLLDEIWRRHGPRAIT